jgi:hypothetical protein
LTADEPGTPSASNGAPPRELRFERGRRKGEALTLAPGELRIGTARNNELQVREAGVSFRHAVVHVAPDGAVTVEDLKAPAGTFVNGERVTGRRALALGDRLRLGDEVELLLAEPRPREPREALAALPPELEAHLPPEILDLRAQAASSRSHEELLAAVPEDALGILTADGDAFVADVWRFIRRDLVPEHPEEWLRWVDLIDPLACFAAPGDACVLARRWEVLAIVPELGRGDTGPLRVAASLGWLLEGAARLAPRRVAELSPGAWSCEYESERPILGRFSRLRAVGDGRHLAIVGTPAVVAHVPPVRSAEDAVEEGLAKVRATSHWRPPASGIGPGPPKLPPGGRYGRLRHKPERPK